MTYHMTWWVIMQPTDMSYVVSCPDPTSKMRKRVWWIWAESSVRWRHWNVIRRFKIALLVAKSCICTINRHCKNHQISFVLATRLLTTKKSHILFAFSLNIRTVCKGYSSTTYPSRYRVLLNASIHSTNSNFSLHVGRQTTARTIAKVWDSS